MEITSASTPLQLPVVFSEGTKATLELSEVMRRAHEIRRLDASPFGRIAILRRLLLPLTYELLGFPGDDDEWTERFEQGRFSEARVADYFREWGSHLNLLDTDRPFDQVAGLQPASGDPKPVSLLVLAEASGNNAPVFANRIEGHNASLTAVEALMALAQLQEADVAGIKTGALGDPAVKAGKTAGNRTGNLGQFQVVVPTGRTLYETLVLNLDIAVLPRRDDRPGWRGDAPTAAWSAREPLGLLDYLTWPARRVRLVVDEEDDAPRIQRVVVTAGDRLEQIPDFEPHALWRSIDKPKPGEPPRRTLRHTRGRAAWEGMSGLLAIGDASAGNHGASVRSTRLLEQIAVRAADGCLPPSYPLDLDIVGIEYGTHNAVIEDLAEESLPLPVMGLVAGSETRTVLIEATQYADGVRRDLNILGDNLRRATNAEPLPWDKGQRIGDEWIATLGAPVRALVRELRSRPEDAEATLARWETFLWLTSSSRAELALDAASPSAFRATGADHPMSVTVAERVFYGQLRKRLAREGARRRSDTSARRDPDVDTAGPTVNEMKEQAS